MEQNNNKTTMVFFFLLVVGLAAGSYAYFRFNSGQPDMAGSPSLVVNSPAGNNSTGTSTMATSTDVQAAGPVSDKTMVTMKTTLGDITLELYTAKAPNTVANFVKLAKSGFYNGTLFHRVIKDFMIQGGDPLTKSEPKNWSVHGTGGPGYAFADEINDIKLESGVLAMANSGPNTNGSQFFIVTAKATPWLDGKHTTFGRVTNGMSVVHAIENVRTGQNDHPQEDVKIISIDVK